MRQISKQGFLNRVLYPIWYKDPSVSGVFFSWVLKPLSRLFGLLSALNRSLYTYGVKRVYYPPVMTLVVGNIHAGGSGKSPLIQTLYEYFTHKGYRVGIVSRGYKGHRVQGTQLLNQVTRADEVGDEAYMTFQRTQAPMVVGARRADAVKRLLKVHPDLNIVLSDDGLQHYALGRDLEIALLPGEASQLPNSNLMPSGPLREPLSRLEQVDFVLTLSQTYCLQQPLSLVDGRPLVPWPSGQAIYAVAGIAHPERFFSDLRTLGFKVTGYAFDDHHKFTQADFAFDQVDRPVLMTEKDAAKCSEFAQTHWYKVPLSLSLDSTVKADILQALITRFKSRRGKTHAR